MTKLKLIFVTMSMASTAVLADSGHYTATLAQALASRSTYVANGNVWRCDGTGCVLASEPKDADSVRSCRALTRFVGAVTAYGSEQEPFDGAKLAKCNAKG